MKSGRLLNLVVLIVLLLGSLPAPAGAMVAEPPSTPAPSAPPRPAPDPSPATGTAPRREAGIESLSGSNVTFNPSAGGDPCFIPGATQTFCFDAHSYTNDWEYVYDLWLKLPTDWTVTDAYVVGTPVCTGGGTWDPFSWSFETSPYEIDIDHARYQAPADDCLATYCVDVVAGASAPQGLASWYWAGDEYASPPHHPCSSDQYTPASMSAYPCDEWLNPQAAIPQCGSVCADWTEAFEAWPPPGWTIVDGGGACVWESTATTGRPNLTGGAGHAADADSGWCGGAMNTELRSPEFSLVGNSSPALVYDYDYYVLSGAETGTVDVTTDGGATWTNLVTYAADDRGPATRAVDLSAYAWQPAVQVRFGYWNANNDRWFEVDDVALVCDAAPDIAVTPSSLSAAQCPDTQTEQTLQICNNGLLPLEWTLSEALGKAPAGSPASNAPAITLPDGAPRSLAEFEAAGRPAFDVRPAAPNLVPAPEALVFYATRADLDTAYPGLPVEGFENGSMGYASLDVIGHPLDQASSNAYFDPGDILPGIQFWATAGHEYDELAVVGEQLDGNPSKTVVADYYTDGYRIVFDPPVEAAGMDLQSFVGNGVCQLDIYDTTGLLASTTSACTTAGAFWGVASDANPIAEIRITDLGGGAEGADNIAFGSPAPDIPWLSESPIVGTLAPGDCQTVTVTFDSTGLAPGDYFGDLLIDSNDPDTPRVTVPVSLTVLVAVSGPEFTWSPLEPVADQAALFTGTVAAGDPPIDYGWDWGDGTAPGSGQHATHVYAAPGDYVVTLTAQNACALATVQHTLTVTGSPDIVVTPPGLAEELCPDATAAQELSICNAGTAPLEWALSEVPGGKGPEAGSLWDTGVLVRTFADHSGYVPVSAESSGAYLFTASGGDTSGNRLARYLPDGTFDAAFAPGLDLRSLDTDNGGALYAKAYNYGFYSLSAGGVATYLFDLPGVDVQSSAAFNGDDGELYARSGSTVRRHSAANGAYLGELTLNGMSGGELAYPANVQVGTDRTGRLFTYADGVVSEWDPAGNRIGTSAVPIATPSGFDTTFSFAVDGDGLVYLLNQNTSNWEVYDIGAGPAADIPWLSESPISGTLAAGDCQTVTVTFDSTGLAPGDYFGDLLIDSNDPDTPRVTVPVSLTVLAPVSGAEFTWSPLGPTIGQTAHFTGTVAAGDPPIGYGWDWGDGTAPGSGQHATHAYAALGDYVVTLTAQNACALVTVQHTVTVTGFPDILVTPPALAEALCPDATATQVLTICNNGDAPLSWALSEITGTGTLGLAPIPPRRDAPGRTDDAAAFPRVSTGSHVDANQVLIVQDDLAWFRWSTPNILSANGIGYDQVGSAQMATVDLTPYVLVIVSSAQSDAFYTAWNANFSRFEAYVASGGALWMGTATSTGGLTNPLLPGGVVLTDDIYAQFGNVAAPGHPWVAGVSSPFEGLWLSHGELANLYPGSIVVATSATTGNPTLVDYAYGAGRVLVTSLTLEIGWDMGWSEGPILQNSLLDMYAPTQDIPWLSEAPAGGTVAVGACATVTVTFDSTGLAPGDYAGELLIESNDPDALQVTVPVSLTVFAPVSGAEFTWSPLNPTIGQTTYFTGTVAAGEPPIGYGWDWGDGTAPGSGQYAAHAYAALGDYVVTLTAQNGCGPVTVQHTVTVTGFPEIDVTPSGLAQELCPDATATQVLTICNTGDAPLIWSVVENVPVAWLAETPTGGTVQPSACATVDVTFDSAGLAAGDYALSLIITSNDVDEPVVIVPVALTVLQPADITGVTYTATFLQVAFDSTAVGSAPLTYAWDFGDGGTSNLADPTHTYETWGCYQVSLVVSNACGQDAWGEGLCVCEPAGGAEFSWSPAAPLVGETASFTATLPTGQPPFTYDWDWGDGTAHGSGEHATHAYAAAGDYDVILTVSNACGQAVAQHTVTVVAPDVDVTPLSLAQELCPDATDTQQVQICNLGDAPLTWSLDELSGTYRYVGRDVAVRVPAVEARPEAAARSAARARAARQVTVHVGWVSTQPVDVLIVTPDVVGGGDISLLLNTLAAFSDLIVTVWDGNAGTPAVVDMLAYDVVFVGNDILWTSSAIDKTVLSNTLADYIDAGGKVLAGSFLWSYDDWGLAGGRFLADDYSPFEMATADIWDPTSLGSYDAGHPLMAGITNVTDNYNHQDPALSSTGTWVASWADGENFVAVSPNVVGLNQLYFHQANFGGQAAELLHNALLYLHGGQPGDVPWLSETPTGGTVQPGGCEDVSVTFDSTGLAAGDYAAGLLIQSDDPDEPAITIPVNLTVFEPADVLSVGYAVTDLQVVFDAVVAGEPPLTYAWTFGDGGTAAVEDPTHTYAAGGCYDVTLAVTNGCGTDTWSGSVCVCEPVGDASFTWSPGAPRQGETIVFTATATGTPPFTYDWDWGDGTAHGSGLTSAHAYAAPGDYTVILTVSNACGQVAVQQTVVVTSGHYYYYVPLYYNHWPPGKTPIRP